MKQIIAIMAFIALCFSAQAQTFIPKTPAQTQSATRGGINAGGTYLSIGYATGNQATITLGTVTPVSSSHPDTLKAPRVNSLGYNTDTGYYQFSNSSNVDKLFDFSVTSLTGTLAGTAVLQGSRDGQNWLTLTGNTTACAGCSGSSATLTGSGTTHYYWYLPKDAEIFPYKQVRAIVTGTCTATFTATQTTAY